MKRLTSLALVVLVLTAGCLGGIGDAGGPGETPEDTQTTADTPDDTHGTSNDQITTDERDTTDGRTTTARGTEPAESVPDGTLAPGVTDEGIENASRLVDAHVDELATRGVNLTLTWQSTESEPMASHEEHVVATRNVQRFRLDSTSVIDGDRVVRGAWMNATMGYQLVRVDAGGDVRYRTPPLGTAESGLRTANAERFFAGYRLASVLRGDGYAVTDVDDDGSVTRYTLVGRNVTGGDRFGERDVTATITASGVVTDLSVAGTRSGGETFTLEYHVHELGVESVERPDWVPGAPTPVEARPTAGFDNCTSPYLLLSNEGPDPVPTDSVVQVELNGSEYRVTLDAALPPGEERALYLTASETLAVTDAGAVPATRTAMPNEAQVTVTTEDGLLLSSGGMGFGCASGGEGSSGGSASGSGGGATSGSSSGSASESTGAQNPP